MEEETKGIPKPVKERDTLDLLELVCQLHTRSSRVGTKDMHDAYVEARQELEARIVNNNNINLSEGKVVAKPKANYEILKQQLLLVAADFQDCGSAAREISKITDKNSFRKAYINTHSDAVEKFDIDIDDKSDEVDDLESEKEDLEKEVRELEEKFEMFAGYKQISATIMGEWKARAFNEHQEKYSWEEVEELMKRGKEFLNQH